MLITLPFLLPALQAWDVNLIWFGVYLVILMEIGCLTPPVGMNLFVIQGVTGLSLQTVVKGAWPFVALLIIGIIIFVVFPDIVLWLPSRMVGN